MQNVTSNSSGMTLIEIMIASTIAIVLGLVVAEMQVQQSRSQNSLEVKAAQQEFNNLVKFKIINSALKALPTSTPTP